MNKYQEAWNNIRSLAETSDYYKECDDKDIELIHELFEKEIPKKPIFNSDVLKCRCCNNELGCDYKFSFVNGYKEPFIIRTNSKYNYCPNCGQMIDWSFEDE